MWFLPTIFAAFLALGGDELEEPVQLDRRAGSFASEAIFPAGREHNHASCLVELPGGELLVAWYRGSGEKDADDVAVLGSRLPAGSEVWSPPFPMADTPGYPDLNPALFAAPDGSTWLFWPTILDHRWEGALLKFKRASKPGDSGPPPWDREGVLHVTPEGFAVAFDEALERLGTIPEAIDATEPEKLRARAGDPLYQRLGWMPRVHPLALPSGRWLLPIYTDTFSASIVTISDDRGETWRASAPLIAFGNIQPSLVRRDDGMIVAFMRDNSPSRRIRISTSTDDGETWSPVEATDLPNPGAGIEAIRLASGRWALAYNDLEAGRHSLAIALSDDEGRTWPVLRHVERSAPVSGSYHYPSLIQARDGTMHLSYTYKTRDGSTIVHARFDEAWLEAGDPD